MRLLTPSWPLPRGIRSAITTRVGGASVASYDGFNLGDHVGDNPEHVRSNRQQLSECVGKDISWLAQVHGTDIVDDSTASINKQAVQADACFSAKPGAVCAVLTADCLPVLLCSQSTGHIAAVHAGWRGLAAGILAKVITKFNEPASSLIAYLGPAISQKNFEVGTDLLDAFTASESSGLVNHGVAKHFDPGNSPDKYFFNIYAFARAEFNALGLHQVYGGEYCTVADDEVFYSYRRDGTTGRFASLIWRD